MFLFNFFTLFLIVLFRYFAIAGFFYWLCWMKKRETWAHKKLEPKFPDRRILFSEMGWSALTSTIFAATGSSLFFAYEKGWTKVYLSISDYGWGYYFASLPILMFLHDTYFYWTHRLMHIPKIYRVFHLVHHHSINPSPWAAFSFHPLEGIVEALIFVILAVFVPVHVSMLLVFLMLMTVLSVVNHLGYELYPSGLLRVPFLGQMITATHHFMHHRLQKGNYGLYFRYWDRWMKTEYASYEFIYDDVTAPAAPREDLAANQ